jgi:phage-related protein
VIREIVRKLCTRLQEAGIPVLEVFSKKTHATPKDVIENCQRRIELYDEATGGRR